MRILYLDIDALKPAHLKCYGYHRDTSPTIDAIAAQGVRFDNVYCSDAPCLPSRTALYTGQLGIQTGVVGHGGSAAQPKVEGKNRDFSDLLGFYSLPFQLQNAGFHTAMISPFAQRHGAHWFTAGFNEYHNTGRRGMESAEEVTPAVSNWLNQHAADDNWFLHINYWDVHTPYRVPLNYGEPFANTPLPQWLDDPELIKRHNAMSGPRTSLDQNMRTYKQDPLYPRHPYEVVDQKSMRRMVDGYDTAIRYVDDQIRLIVDQLKLAGVYEDTAIIISSDHGENMGELGIYAEHATADEGTCHLPLIVKWPSQDRSPTIAPFADTPGKLPLTTRTQANVTGTAQPGGRVDSALRYHLDLAPTLMELMGRPIPQSWDGQSYADAVIGKPLQKPTDAKQPSPRSELIISQCAHVCQRSVRFENWIYIRTYHDGLYPFPQEMLFDLANDPHEQNDVASKHPEVLRDGAWRLAKWHDEQMQKMAKHSSDVVDPLWTVIHEGGPYQISGILPGYLDRLEATGRSAAAAAIRKKYNLPHKA